ncbi:MAG: hypothetical protein WBA33_12070 [Rhodanobacter lindaniclasticus]
MNAIKKIALFDVLPFICHLTAVVLLCAAAYTVGFPPSNEVSNSAWIEALVGTFFLLLPAAKKISLGKLITFEREVEKIKEEVSETREQMTNFLGVYSSMLTTISNTMKQTVNLTFHPGWEERQQAREAISGVQDQAAAGPNNGDAVEAFIVASGGDFNFALAKIRMELERSLRDYLGKRTSTPDPTQMRERFMSASQLFKLFLEANPNLSQLRTSFEYVLKICNAAIHGQLVEEKYAKEAIHMGLSLAQEIKNVATPPTFE